MWAKLQEPTENPVIVYRKRAVQATNFAVATTGLQNPIIIIVVHKAIRRPINRAEHVKRTESWRLNRTDNERDEDRVLERVRTTKNVIGAASNQSMFS